MAVHDRCHQLGHIIIALVISRDIALLHASVLSRRSNRAYGTFLHRRHVVYVYESLRMSSRYL
jgi:ribosomal protein L34E